LKRFVEQDLGLEFKFDAMINPRLDCSQSPLEVRLTPAQVVELDLRYSGRACEWQYFAERFLNSENDASRQANLYVCGAGQHSFAIDPYGKLRLCILSAGANFDLRQGSFREGWDKHLAAARQKKTLRRTKCTRCLLRPMCGVCPANSQLECSDEAAPVDFLCRVAHLRAYALELPVAPHGACEYCKGGSGYAAMIETAKRLKERFA